MYSGDAGLDRNDEDARNDADFLTNVTRTDTHRVVVFGKGTGSHGRDSRYWDRDDRRRDDDYNEDAVEHSSDTGRVKASIDEKRSDQKGVGSDQRGVGLYNEAGRNELKKYEAEYMKSLENVGQSESDDGRINNQSDGGVQREAIDEDDEYDDKIEFDDSQGKEHGDYEHDDKGDRSGVGRIQSENHTGFEDVEEASRSSLKSRSLGGVFGKSRRGSVLAEQSTKSSQSKRKRRRKFSH